jgi:thioesterase domain-containing protein
MIPGGMGGEANVDLFFYARLAHHVGADFPFYGLRPKGADGTEAPHRSVKRMAAAYLAEICAFQPQGPYYLTGACIGGVLAYEMACQLEAKGEKVAFLGLLDTDFPTRTDYLRFRTRPLANQCRAATLGLKNNYYFARAIHHWRELKKLDWRKIPQYFTERGIAGLSDLVALDDKTPRELSVESTPPQYGGNQLNDAMKQFQYTYESALRRHRPRLYWGALTMISAEELVNQRNEHLGWKSVARGAIETYVLPGNHISLFRKDVHVLGTKLRECLVQSQAHCLITPSTQGREEFSEETTLLPTAK